MRVCVEGGSMVFGVGVKEGRRGEVILGSMDDMII